MPFPGAAWTTGFAIFISTHPPSLCRQSATCVFDCVCVSCRRFFLFYCYVKLRTCVWLCGSIPLFVDVTPRQQLSGGRVGDTTPTRHGGGGAGATVHRRFFPAFSKGKVVDVPRSAECPPTCTPGKARVRWYGCMQRTGPLLPALRGLHAHIYSQQAKLLESSSFSRFWGFGFLFLNLF